MTDSLKTWTITQQTISPDGNQFGTITYLNSSGGKWTYNGSLPSDEETEQDWSSWIDNNPPLIRKEDVCLKHEWVDTGARKTWCKLCDKSGRWELGNVVLDDSRNED